MNTKPQIDSNFDTDKMYYQVPLAHMFAAKLQT